MKDFEPQTLKNIGEGLLKNRMNWLGIELSEDQWLRKTNLSTISILDQ